MEWLSDKAIEIINELHTERLDYESEYLPLIEAAQKLSAYEDTGMEPENVNDLLERFQNLYSIFDDLYLVDPVHFQAFLERVRSWYQAEKDGRLVVPPCKVGDMVYLPLRDGIHAVRVKGIRISAGGKDTVLHLDIGSGEFRWGSDKGRTWFSTRQEAEAAMEREEGQA